MKIPSRSARVAVAVLATVHVMWTPAQTPAQMEYERQQREYARQQEQQRQDQQRQQQIMNENARRQQEGSSRINAPSGQGQAPGYPGARTQGAPRQTTPQQETSRVDASVATAAAKWALRGTLSDYGGVDIYSDPVTLRRSGNVARMWEMWDFKAMQVVAQKRVMSLKNLMEFDCGGSRRWMISTTGYSEHLGRGRVVASGDLANSWEPVTGGYPETLWKSACGRQ